MAFPLLPNPHAMPELRLEAALSPAPRATLSNNGAAAARWLQRSLVAWLAVALAGQAVFAAYVLGFYGRAALAGEPGRWNKVLPRGWVEGQTFDNAVLALHLLFTVVLVVGGALQLLPALRRRWPALHRWNGRSYLLAAAVLALGGLWLVWVRGGVVGDLSQHLAISVNALLILGCAALAWRAARERRFDAHRRWALRLFVAASGVWFFRVGLMAWLGLMQAPVGFDPKTFSGPFLTALAWGVYALVPLLVLEGVLRAQRSGQAAPQAAMATLMALLVLAMAFGTVVASLGMWLPRMG
jgi:hypothetical protein